MFLEAYQDLTAGNIALLALIAVAFLFVFFVFLKRLIGFAFWALILLAVLTAGFAIYDDRVAAALKDLVSPAAGNTETAKVRAERVYELVKQDAAEVLSKWQFLWSPALKKDQPTPPPAQPQTLPAPTPAPSQSVTPPAPAPAPSTAPNQPTAFRPHNNR